MPERVRVTVNCAMSADGKLALAGGRPLRLSSEADFARVHRLRQEHDAILVGVETVLKDDPSLLVKETYLRAAFEGDAPAVRHPLRVIVDSRRRTPPTARVLDDRAPTLVAVATGNHGELPGADVLECGSEGGRVHLPTLLDQLHARGVRSLMVEGGGTLIHAFLRARLVDDLLVYVAPRVVGGGAPSLAEGPGAATEADALDLTLAHVERLGEGVLLHWRPAP